MSHKTAMTREAKQNRVDALAEALTAANKAAEAARTDDDGGSCNMDTVIIDLKGWKPSEITEATEKAGVKIGDKMRSGFWRGCRFVWTAVSGQGNRRTRMVEAAAKTLRDAGYKAQVWYQMD